MAAKKPAKAKKARRPRAKKPGPEAPPAPAVDPQVLPADPADAGAELPPPPEPKPADPNAPKPRDPDHPDLLEKVFIWFSKPIALEAAARACGISHTTFYAWLKRGAEDQFGPYRRFKEAVEWSLAQCERDLVATVQRHATFDWKAAAWLLQRRFGLTWGEKAEPQRLLKNEGDGVKDEDITEEIAAVRQLLRARAELDAPAGGAARAEAPSPGEGASVPSRSKTRRDQS